MKRSILCGLVAAMALGACSAGRNSGLRLALTPAAVAVFVGERTSLTPVFDGDRASIDGDRPRP